MISQTGNSLDSMYSVCKPQNTEARRAIVIGGSMAGLLAARVLANHYDQVLILERDPVNSAPEFRKGQPQTRHTHVLLARGLEILRRYFPDLEDGIKSKGAEVVDFARHASWYLQSGYAKRFDSEMPCLLSSRPLLEAEVRAGNKQVKLALTPRTAV